MKGKWILYRLLLRHPKPVSALEVPNSHPYERLNLPRKEYFAALMKPRRSSKNSSPFLSKQEEAGKEENVRYFHDSKRPSREKNSLAL